MAVTVAATALLVFLAATVMEAAHGLFCYYFSAVADAVAEMEPAYLVVTAAVPETMAAVIG